ncbi:MAG TPA: dicarboxylate/amino acid:cation symporter [Phycisphaerae bacterium]|nr:dicarboxylate/amino acid:cation symporter [Phycisphaerae bacterium]
MSGKRQHLYILLGLVIGALAGIAADWIAGAPVDSTLATTAPAETSLRASLDWFTRNITDTVGKIFLRLIFMVVVPLVFAALVLGVYEVGDVRRLGRIGLLTLALTFCFSSIAAVIGITAVNTIRPGEKLSPAKRDALREQYAKDAGDIVGKASRAKPVRDTIVDIIPENPIQEMVGALDGSSKGNGMLAVMFFSLLFGIALTVLPLGRAPPVIDVLRAVFDACMVIIGWAMWIAPVAVACLVFSATARLGPDVLRALGWFAITALLGLLIQLFVVYPLALQFIARWNPLDFFRRIRAVIVTGFATSSSNATLPASLKCAEEDLRLPPQVGRFVLTVGATGNQNGTALYEGVVVLFLAQAFGIHLDLGQQVTVVLMCVLAGIGTAGVPGGSLPLIAVLCGTVGVPPEGIGIILGVDRILDMVRTVVNVVGDLVVATCVARKSPAADVRVISAQS